MSDVQRNIRRAALRVLYAIDVSDQPVEAVLAHVDEALREDGDDPAAYWDQVVRAVRALLEKQSEIDEEIRVLSPKWRIERMAAVDRNLLRLGIYEILSRESVPLHTINACVELAKEFGAASTPGFINGLLDQLCQNHKITISGS